MELSWRRRVPCATREMFNLVVGKLRPLLAPRADGGLQGPEGCVYTFLHSFVCLFDAVEASGQKMPPSVLLSLTAFPAREFAQGD